MLVERHDFGRKRDVADHPPFSDLRQNQERAPLWLRQFRDHHAHAAHRQSVFKALAAQIDFELSTLTKLVRSNARRTVIDQSVALINRLLGRCERTIHDDPSLEVYVNDYPQLRAALEKRRERREAADTETREARNALVLQFNQLCERIASDIDLVDSSSGKERGRNPAFERDVFARLKMNVSKVRAMMAEDATLDPTNQNVAAYLERQSGKENEHG